MRSQFAFEKKELFHFETIPVSLSGMFNFSYSKIGQSLRGYPKCQHIHKFKKNASSLAGGGGGSIKKNVGSLLYQHCKLLQLPSISNRLIHHKSFYHVSLICPYTHSMSEEQSNLHSKYLNISTKC